MEAFELPEGYTVTNKEDAGLSAQDRLRPMMLTLIESIEMEIERSYEPGKRIRISVPRNSSVLGKYILAFYKEAGWEGRFDYIEREWTLEIW